MRHGDRSQVEDPRQGNGHIIPASPELLQVAARRIRVLGHPLRLRMFEALGSGPCSVSELAAVLGVELQLASKHISELYRAGLVQRRQDGWVASPGKSQRRRACRRAAVCPARADKDRRRRLRSVEAPSADRAATEIVQLTAIGAALGPAVALRPKRRNRNADIYG